MNRSKTQDVSDVVRKKTEVDLQNTVNSIINSRKVTKETASRYPKIYT